MKPGDLVRAAHTGDLTHLSKLPGDINEGSNPSIGWIGVSELAMIIATTDVTVYRQGEQYVRKEVLCLVGTKLGWAIEKDVMLA